MAEPRRAAARPTRRLGRPCFRPPDTRRGSERTGPSAGAPQERPQALGRIPALGASPPPPAPLGQPGQEGGVSVQALWGLRSGARAAIAALYVLLFCRGHSGQGAGRRGRGTPYLFTAKIEMRFTAYYLHVRFCRGQGLAGRARRPTRRRGRAAPSSAGAGPSGRARGVATRRRVLCRPLPKDTIRPLVTVPEWALRPVSPKLKPETRKCQCSGSHYYTSNCRPLLPLAWSRVHGWPRPPVTA